MDNKIEEWKKGDHAFIIAQEIDDIVEIKLLEKCAYDPKRWIFSVLHSKGKEFNRRSIHYLSLFRNKLSALKRYQEIITFSKNEQEEAIKEMKVYVNNQKKILSKISKEIEKEKSK